MVDDNLGKRILVKILKVTGWILASVLFLLILIIILIRLPSVQNRLTQKAITFLEGKIKTNVDLKSIYIAFPTKIVLEGLYVEDQQKDSLLYVGELNIDTDLWSLTQHRIQLNKIELNSGKASIQRTANDSTYNFDYIITAFTSPSEPTDADTTKSTWEFSVETVALSKINFSYDDKLDGNDVSLYLGELSLSLDEFDIEKSVYKISSISLANTRANISQYKVDTLAENLASDSTVKSSSINLDVDDIDLENIKLRYSQVALGQTLNFDIGHLLIEANTIDLTNNLVDLNEVELTKSFVSLQSNAKDDETKTTNDAPVSFEINSPWNIKLSKLTLSDNSFQYYNFALPFTNSSIDFNHLWIIGLEISAKDLALTKNEIQADLKNLSFREKNGFTIQSLATNVTLNNSELNLRSFLLQSGYSKIEMNGRATYASLQSLATEYDRAKINFEINNSTIALQDILFLYPTLLDSLPLTLPAATVVTLNTNVKGQLGNLNVPSLSLRTLDSTYLEMEGHIKGLPNIDRTTMEVRIEKIYTTNADLTTIFPDSLLASVQIPHWISLSASASGLVKAPVFKALLKSSAGSIDADGKVDFTSITRYDISLKTKELDLGKILKQDSTLGTLDMQAGVKGSGTSMEELDAAFEINISKFQYANYDYKDFKLNGSMKKYLFSGDASLHDQNIDFVLKGDMDYQGEVPLYKFSLDVKNIDFKGLKLSERPLKARAMLDVTLATADFKVVNGNIALRKVAVFNGQALYMVDSLLFASIDQKGESSLDIQSDIISGNFKGSFNVFSLPMVLRKHIDQYFSLQDSSISKINEPQKFSFDLTIKNTDLLTEVLFPELEPFVPGEIKGEFDSERNKLDIKIALSTIRYNTVGADSISLKITSDAQSLNYKLALKNILIDTLKIYELQIGGEIKHDSIRTRLTILDSLAKTIYLLGGVIKSDNDKFKFHFMPNEVMLNYNNWSVPTDNYLQFGMKGLHANNFSLSKENEKLSLITSSKDSIVSLVFNELRLSNITKIIAGVVPADGKINGDIKFTTSGNGEFSSKLLINDLTILEKKWGNANFSMSHTQAQNRYTVNLAVNGENSVIKASGYYVPHDQASEFDLSIDLSPFNLQLIEPLTGNQLKNVKGSLEGNLKLTGNTAKPIVRGKLNFKEATFFVDYLKGKYTLKNEMIEFKESGIGFSNFTITDDKNNEAILKGDVLTKAYKDFDLRLRMTTKNFKILHTTPDDNKLYYGNVNINASARIIGNFTQPRVTLNLSLTEGSTLTYVVPQSQKMVLEQKGIVQFVDKDAIKDPFLANVHLEDTVQSVFKGLELTANLELTDKEILNIIIDPVTGDKLSVQGNSTLTLDIDASGNMNLAGRYEITKGAYNFSFYKLVKRKFDIVKGSTIIWAGNPLNASLDIRASNTVETSPLDLVSNQITSTNQQDLNAYKQRLPFLVYLNIKGQLLTPEISFELDMPVDKRNALGGAIYAKIQDINSRESDLNKQVFALLILKRFISDNPLESESGSDLNNTARLSVSRLLSEQLNRLSEKVKGVQLTVDIKSYQDYSAGEVQGQTIAQLGVSKSLFNDRLVVKLAGNLDLEGETSSQDEVTDYIGDLALEYKLTADGRLRVTGFRNSNYDMVNGELTETGVGLIYIKDYNTLRELFKANESEK